jgi:hypothetical protein
MFPWPGTRTGYLYDIRLATSKDEMKALGGFTTPHGLRHTFTTVSNAAQANPYISKLLSGHALPEQSDPHAGYINSHDIEAMRPAAQAIANKLREWGLKV